MLKLMKDMPDDVLGVLAEGKITEKDYETVFFSAVERKLREHQKIGLLYYLGSEFTGFKLGAMWDDTKLGMKHLSAWNGVALMSNHKMVNAFAKLFGYMFPCEYHVFKNSQFEEAKKWIAIKVTHG